MDCAAVESVAAVVAHGKAGGDAAPVERYFPREKKQKKKHAKPSGAADEASTARSTQLDVSEVSRLAARFVMSHGEADPACPLVPRSTAAGIAAQLLALASAQSFVTLTPPVLQWLRANNLLLSKLAMLADEKSVLDAFQGKEFIYAPIFSCEFIDAAAQKGVFPMTSVLASARVFAAKLHDKRCLVPTAADILSAPILHERSVRKHAKKYSLVVDEYWDDAVVLIRREHTKKHGECWLIPPLERCLKRIHLEGKAAALADSSSAHAGGGGGFRTHVHCFVVFNNAKAKAFREANPDAERLPASCIAAAEIGFVVGDIYTSMTGGFDSSESGAGSVQLASLLAVLLTAGIHVLDLGMTMNYKVEHLGGVELPRKRWLKLVAQRCSESPRHVKTLHELVRVMNCRQWIEAVAHPLTAVVAAAGAAAIGAPREEAAQAAA